MNSKGGFDMEYMKKEVGIKEKIYNIEEKLEVNKLKEYIIKYLIKNKIANLDKNCHERIEEYSIFPLDLKKIKFLVFPLKISDYDEKIIIFRNRERFIKGKINIDSKDYFFDSHLCFVILYSSEKKINFLFEELIDKIIEKIEEYCKL